MGMFIMNIKNESSIFLLKKIWQFADHKKSIIVFITMFIIANTILLLGPIIFGAFIGEIQKNGVHFNNINYLFLLLFAMFAKEFVFWIIHGPARVLERNQAFAAMLNYRRYLLNGVLNLGLSWHSEHDSGNTIDKVNKASEGFFEFGQNIFQIIEIIVKLVGTSVVLLFFSPIIGFLVFVCAVISLIIIFNLICDLYHNINV